MRILCIAASQVAGRRKQSYSYIFSDLIRQIAREHNSQYDVDILHLAEKELRPCCMCAKCSDNGLCVDKDAFNEINSVMKQADVIFIVCPHYAGLPSKLTILLEKLQELCFISLCKNAADSWQLKNKPVGLIVHGGATQEYLPNYLHTVLKPLSHFCKSIGMVLKDSADYENGIIFGVTGYQTPADSILPDMVYDWGQIKKELSPFISQYLV